jgi:hypothetical protein
MCLYKNIAFFFFVLRASLEKCPLSFVSRDGFEMSEISLYDIVPVGGFIFFGKKLG